jgi:hypothetical protein
LSRQVYLVCSSEVLGEAEVCALEALNSNLKALGESLIWIGSDDVSEHNRPLLVQEMLVVLSSVEVCPDLVAKLGKRESFASKVLVVVRLRFASQHSAKGGRVLVCSNPSFSAKVIKDVKLEVKDVMEVSSEPELVVVQLAEVCEGAYARWLRVCRWLRVRRRRRRSSWSGRSSWLGRSSWPGAYRAF